MLKERKDHPGPNHRDKLKVIHIMQSEGKPKFLRYHSKVVKGVAFSPKDRHLFCSGGDDGKINIYNAHNASVHNLLLSFKLTTPSTGKYDYAHTHTRLKVII